MIEERKNEIERFAKELLMPKDGGNARVYSPGRTDIGEFREALLLLLSLLKEV